MFNKLIGGMLVVASTSIYGYMLTKELTNRIIVLKQLKRAFLLLKSEIRYSMETLPDAFINVSNKFNECEKEIGFFFGRVGERIKETADITFKEIWESQVNELKKQTNIDGKDGDKLMSLGDGLGYLDVTQQLNNIDQYIEALEADIEELSGKYKESCKLYTSLGVMAGLFLTIILI